MKKIINFTKKRLGSLPGWIILFGTGSFMLCISWRKWPDILVDFGRELYIPWCLNNGAVLYRDIAYFNGPFSPYLNSILFRIFGTSLMTVVFFNILLIVLLTLLIYRIFYLTTNKFNAVSAAVTFLAVFAFSQYGNIGNYNFVCPYSHDIAHGIILSFLALYIFYFYIISKKIYWLSLIGFLFGLIFLTKIEVFVAFGAAISSGICLFFVMERTTVSRIAAAIAVLFVSALLPVTGFTIYLSSYMPTQEVLLCLVTPYLALSKTTIVSNLFYKKIMGMDDPLSNFVMSVIVTAVYILSIALIGLIGNRIRLISDKKRLFKAGTAIILLVFCLMFLTLKNLRCLEGWMWVGRGLPFAMVFLISYLSVLLAGVYREDKLRDAPRLLLLISLAVFALALLFKIILNAHVYHYGFALAMPATILLVMIFLYIAPEFLGRLVGNAWFIRYIALIIVLAGVLGYVILARMTYNLKTYPVGSGADTILTFSPQISTQGTVIENTLKKLREIKQKNENFVVMPEGVIFNYMLRVKSPIPYVVFMPPEIDIFGEEQILMALKKNPPDYVILADKDTSEYGYHFFGKDYGVSIYTWIAKNYKPLSLFGEPPFSGKGFGIILMQRDRSRPL